MNPLRTFWCFMILSAIAGMIGYGIGFNGGFILYFLIPALLGVHILCGAGLGLIVFMFNKLLLPGKVTVWIAPMIIAVISLAVLAPKNSVVDFAEVSLQFLVPLFVVPAFAGCVWSVLWESRVRARERSEADPETTS